MSEDFGDVVEGARKAFWSGISRSIDFRKRQLRSLARMLDENEAALMDALKKDLFKCEFEAYVMEIHYTRVEIIGALEKIDEWAKPDKVKGDITFAMSTLSIRKEPFGVCLILGAWNFPIPLLLVPLIGAIAAGNCAVLKPSELAVNTAELLQRLIPKYLDKKCYPVVVAGPDGSARLINENRFDLIFYTGGTTVGRIVMSAAAKNLTPVVLELGGKNPCYVHKSADLNKAARRVYFGRFVNAGQICLAPDYVLCDEEVRDEFVSNLKSVIQQFLGQDPKSSEFFGRIINDRHFSRLQKLLDCGTVATGGQHDAKERYIAPTVLTDVDEDSSVMQEEIFGPILPVLTVKGVDQAIASINRRERPLSLYVFSKDKQIVEQLLNSTSSGGVTVNDTIMHHNQFLPFGGVGHSGMGCYHGKYGFDAFSHKRSCLEQGTPEMLLSIRYPPYAAKTLARFRSLKKKIPGQGGGGFRRFIFLALMGVLIGYLLRNFFKLG